MPSSWTFGGRPDASPSQPPRAAVQAGKPFGGYRIVGTLGEGAHGVVYSAVDPQGRSVALKVLKSRFNAKRRARFKREGELAAKLDHPGILRVQGGGEHQGQPFLVYDLVEDGRELNEYMRDLGVDARVRALLSVAEAVGYAHANGVVHRDLKMANILVDGEGRLRVADFGLAKAEGGLSLTRTGEFLGTPMGMAPEQMLSEHDQVGPHTDVWAIGVILYEAICDEPPFNAGSFRELQYRIVQATPTKPTAIVPDLSPELEAICLKALSKEVSDRYSDGNALAADLGACLARGSRPRSSGRSRVSAGRLGSERWARIAVAGLSAAALGLGIAVIAIGRGEKSDASGAAEISTVTTLQSVEATPEVMDVGPLDPAERKRKVQILLRRAHDRAAVGRNQEALEDTRAALVLRPGDAQLWTECGELFARVGDSKQSIAAYSSALKIDGASQLARYNRGVERQRLRDFPGALRDYEYCVDNWPDFSPGWRALGLVLHQTGRFEEAVEAYGEALVLLPDFAPLYYSRALSNLKRDPALGLADLNACLRLDPGHAKAWFERGVLKEGRGDDAGAMADYTDAIGSEAHFVDALFARALLRERSRNFVGAKEDYLAVLEATPNDAMTLVNLGSVLKRSGEPKAALERYTAAVGADPSYLMGWIARAQLLYAEKQYAAAAKDFTEAMQRDERPLLQVNRAMARKYSGDIDGAREDLKHVLSTVDPSDRQAIRAKTLLEALEKK
jgi:tetratricopeptide (TPR) repeat protein/predicted Ser/Thr protein kinase